MNENIYNKLNTLAEQAGCDQIKDNYNEVRMSMQRSIMKQYAVLGDVNAGKSTIINILAGEKKLPVSVRSNEHGKVAFVESDEHKCRWVELSTSAYIGDGVTETESPLWYIDAAIYVLSATTPFSQQDVTAIKACLSHGVPCSLVLNKLDATDESEKDEIIAYIKTQAERHFGSDSLIVINTKDEEATKQAIMNDFASAEDSIDIRDYLLAVSYAKVLKAHIAEKYDSVKKKMQIASDNERKTKQAILDEKIAWDKIKLEIESRKLKLIEAMSVEMNRLYADCIAALADKAMLATSPKAWWEQSLEKEFRREIVRMSNKIDRLICTQFTSDRDWLVQSVEKQFGSKLSVDTSNSETQLEDVVFGVAPDGLNSTRTTKTIAMAGLVVSSVALCGVLVYPALAMHSINALYWKLAGVAVAGTGFWTFMETKKEKAERQQCLKSEIARYILGSRDDNIEVLKKNIEYGYKSMGISIQDLQLATAKAPASEGDSKILAEFKAISEINRMCDEIVSSLLSNEE